MVDVEKYITDIRMIRTRLSRPEWSHLTVDERHQLSIAILAELAKDRRMEQIREERSAKKPGQQNFKSWRDDPVSLDQISFLERHKIPFTPGMTKGQASDLIDAQVKKWQGKD